MNKALTIVIMIMSIIILVLLGIKCKDNIQQVQIVQRQKSIKMMLNDIYSPSSMEEFDKSYSKYKNKLISEAVANNLYTKTGEELTELDTRRSSEIGVYYSKLNSFNKDCYIAEVWLYNNGDIINNFKILFMFNGDIIEDYILEVIS